MSLRARIPASAVLAMLVAVVAGATVATATRNGSTEPENLLSPDQHTSSSIEGWQARENAAISQSVVIGYDDHRSLQVTAVADGPASAGTPQGADGIPVTGGRWYAGALHVQPATMVARVSCQLVWYGADGEALAVEEGSPVEQTARDWIEIGCTGQAPEEATHAELRVVVHDAREHDVHHVDAASMFDVTPAFAGELLVSQHADRSSAVPLSGSTQSGSTYVFAALRSASAVSSVVFSIDGTAVQTEHHLPYDLAGGSAETANPYDTTALADGPHTLTATIHLRDGRTRTLSAEFAVDNRSSDPTAGPSPSPTGTSSPTPTQQPSPSEHPSSPPPGASLHGTDITAANTGLRGAGYVHDPSSDTWSHPDRGPLEVVDDSLDTTHDGQVIEHVQVNGMIKVHHRDVTIRNVRVLYSGTLYAIDALRHIPDDANLTIEFVEIEHAGGDDSYIATGVRGEYTTVARSHIHGGFGTCIVHHTTGTSSHNLCHELATADGAHQNGIALERTSGAAGPFHVVGNRTEGGSTATITMFARSGPFEDVIVADNLLSGGTSPSYCFHGPENKGAGDGTRDVRVTGNVFDRDPFPQCGEHGPYRNWDGSRPGAQWCDNRFIDGEAVGVETGC